MIRNVHPLRVSRWPLMPVSAMLLLNMLFLAAPVLAQGTDQQLRLLQDSALTLAFSPLLVDAVREHNAKRLDIEQIRERQRQWTSDPAPTGFKRQLQYNRAAGLLRHLVAHHDAVRLVMLTDEQGALVASYPMADEYWLANQPAWRMLFEGHERPTVAVNTDGGATRQQIGAAVRDDGRLIGALLLITDR